MIKFPNKALNDDDLADFLLNQTKNIVGKKYDSKE